MNQRGKITSLLFFFCLCATAVVVHHFTELRAEWTRPVDLYEVVYRQLEACRAKNFPEAYNQVSSTFQQHWSLFQFSGMMQTDFSRVLKAERVEFGQWERRGHRAMIEVFFIGDDGHVFPCIYSLISEGNGWKIDAARPVKGWPTGQRMRGLRS